MLIGKLSHLASAWSALDETLFDQIRLIYFLDGAGILTQSCGYGGQTNRAAFEFADYSSENLVVDFVKPVPVNIQCLKSISGDLDRKSVV